MFDLYTQVLPVAGFMLFIVVIVSVVCLTVVTINKYELEKENKKLWRSIDQLTQDKVLELTVNKVLSDGGSGPWYDIIRISAHEHIIKATDNSKTK